MSIINEYRLITERIAVVESHITSANRELRKIAMSYGPSGLKSFSFDERVQGCGEKKSAVEVAEEMISLNNTLSAFEEELAGLKDQRQKLENAISSVSDNEKKAAMWNIKGLKPWQIAKKMGYSKRQVERFLENINKNVG